MLKKNFLILEKKCCPVWEPALFSQKSTKKTANPHKCLQREPWLKEFPIYQKTTSFPIAIGIFENFQTVKYVYVLGSNKWWVCFLHQECRSSQFSTKKNQWSLDFGPDSVVLTVKDLVLELRKSSKEISLPAYILLFQKEEFLNNLLDWIPFHSQAARVLWKEGSDSSQCWSAEHG